MITMYLYRNYNNIQGMPEYITREEPDNVIPFYTGIESRDINCTHCKFNETIYVSKVFPPNWCPRCADRIFKQEIEKIQADREATKTSPYPEFVPEHIKDERKKYAKDIVQSHRQGELSQEFVENYGDKLLDQVKDGVLSSDEIRKSKNVWGRDLPGIESQKGKYTKEEIVHRAQEIERKRNR